MKIDKQKEIAVTIGKFTALMVSAKELFEGEKMTTDEVIRLNTAVSVLIKKFSELDPKDRFFFHFKWEHQHNGRDYGFGYLANYIAALFLELAEKRYNPKVKNLSNVMRIAHQLKRKGASQSVAMAKGYKIIERSGKLRTDSIQDECKDISETCAMGLWNGISTSYPCLMKGPDGRDNFAKPKAKAVQLIADFTYAITVMIGYK
jgi:hypothetical protein